MARKRYTVHLRPGSKIPKLPVGKGDWWAPTVRDESGVREILITSDKQDLASRLRALPGVEHVEEDLAF